MGRVIAGVLFATMKRGAAVETEPADGQKPLSGAALGYALSSQQKQLANATGMTEISKDKADSMKRG